MDCRVLFLLKGDTLQVQSFVLRLLGQALADRSCQVSYFHHPEDPLVLEGLLVPFQGVGVLTADHPAARGGPFPQHLVVKVVELPEGAVSLFDHRLLYEKESQGDTCRNLRAQVNEDIAAVSIAGWVQELQEKKPSVKHYFAGSIAAEGVVEFIDHITGFCSKRYVLQGEQYTGAVLMREVLLDALSRHFFVEAFHSWIDPADLVVLVFPEIGVAVVDGTSGCKLTPLPGDVVWELGRTSGISRGVLADDGELLEKSQEVLENDGHYLTEEEINPIVTRLIKEIMGSTK